MKKFILYLVCLIIFSISCLAFPINFTYPTPSNNSIQPSNFIPINITTSLTEENTVNLNFDNTLISWYTMDNISGTTLYDKMGRYNGVIFGSVGKLQGKWGNATNYTHTGDYIQLNGNPTNYGWYQHSFTTSAWVYRTGWKDTSDADIVGTQCNGFSTNNCYYMMIRSNHTLCGFYGSGYDLNGKTNLTINQWYHVSCNFEVTTRNLTTYLNGNQEASMIMPASFNQPSVTVYISNWVPDTARYFNGIIDDVMFYNRSLSIDEIKSVYNATLYPYYKNFTNLASKTYQFQACVQNISGDMNCTETRYVNMPDTQSPKISFIYPFNRTYIDLVTILNYTASDNIALDKCWYSINNGANSSPSACNNFTGIITNNGQNNATIWANDTSGNIGFANTNFTIDLSRLSIRLLSQTVTYFPVRNLTWFYVSVNVSCSGADCGTVNTTLDPLQISGTVYSVNYGFFDTTSNLVSAGVTTSSYIAWNSGTLANTCTKVTTNPSSGSWNGPSYYYTTIAQISSVSAGNQFSIYSTQAECLASFGDIKSGTVPMNSGNPFYTTVKNPNSTLLNDGESIIITYPVFVNTSRPSGYNYTVFVYVNKTRSPISNKTTSFNVSVMKDSCFCPAIDTPWIVTDHCTYTETCNFHGTLNISTGGWLNISNSGYVNASKLFLIPKTNLEWFRLLIDSNHGGKISITR